MSFVDNNISPFLLEPAEFCINALFLSSVISLSFCTCFGGGDGGNINTKEPINCATNTMIPNT